MIPANVDGSVVKKIRNLQPKSVPKHLTKNKSKKTAGDFDPNVYFDVLSHIAMKDGFTLDYVYHYIDGFGGNPCLYARPKDIGPFVSFLEHRDWDEKNNLQSFLIADGKPEGFFQLSVFYHLASQFYLSWHANYDDTDIITSFEDAAALIKSLNEKSFGAKVTEEQTSSIMAILPEPSVTLTDTEAQVIYCIFTKWGGYRRLRETFMRKPPHMVLDREVLDAVTYDCGICF